MPNRKRGWRNCGVYVWRTRKPHAFLGLPVIGRHTAYVGKTGNRYFRDRQHLFGDTRYGAAGKPWADLAPKVYPLPCLFPHWDWARSAQEALWIWLLMPVYNVQLNIANPRRITPTKAQQQRWARQAKSRPFNIGQTVMRGAAMLAFWALIGIGAWQTWVA